MFYINNIIIIHNIPHLLEDAHPQLPAMEFTPGDRQRGPCERSGRPGWSNMEVS